MRAGQSYPPAIIPPRKMASNCWGRTEPNSPRARKPALRNSFTPFGLEKGPRTPPVLGATELTVFKAFFDRTKDWADIEAMIDAGTVDTHGALGWLVDLLGGDDHRVARLRRLLDRKPAAEEPRFMQ